MKKIIKALFLNTAIVFGIVTSALFAQEAYPCHTDQKKKEFLESLTPSEKIEFQQQAAVYEQEIQEYIANHPELLSNSHTRSIKYTIPVVFHIIHQNGAENISDEQVFDAVEHLNKDYQKQNSNWHQVVSTFLSRVADVEIEFKLAKLDPDGNCTNGITRTYSSTTSSGVGIDQVNAVRDAQGDWLGNKYLNIFVAKNIGGAAGYTMYPNNWLGGKMTNGIFVLHNYVGGIGTSSSKGIHTLSHEAGHWLNLPHTWGDSNEPGLSSNCGGDDGVGDTPNTIGWDECNLSGTSCGSLDNVENFMEYSYCSKMFTLGQKARMHAALKSTVGGRNKIWSPSNLLDTGVGLPAFLCEADFKSNITEVCVGQTVTFDDQSYSGVTNRKWNFQGGNPANSTNENPSVTYSTPGDYEVKLIVSDGVDTASVTKTAYIRVLNEGVATPFVEGFEKHDSLSESPFWSVENSGDNAAFEIVSDANFSGSQSIKLENFGQSSGNIDAITSQPIDLSSINDEDKVTLSFRYAYRKKKSSNNEILKIKISNNCGVTWAQRKTIKGNTLGDEIVSSSWTPTSSDDWTTVHVTNITSSYWVDNFRVKFEFESDGGNNLYIDDINIYSGEPLDEPLSSINENTLVYNFNIYPNPAENIANVAFMSKKDQKMEVSLINIMGQIIQTNAIQAKNGNNLVTFNTENIDAGIYFIKLNMGGYDQTQRLIIQ